MNVYTIYETIFFPGIPRRRMLASPSWFSSWRIRKEPQQTLHATELSDGQSVETRMLRLAEVEPSAPTQAEQRRESVHRTSAAKRTIVQIKGGHLLRLSVRQ